MKKTIYARTNADFLNQVFGTNYRAWMKSRWEYDEDTWVWMVRFDQKLRIGWANRIISDKEIWETYIGAEPPTYVRDKKKYRIVVATKDTAFGREYQILGLYQFDNTQSGLGRHVFIKVREQL